MDFAQIETLHRQSKIGNVFYPVPSFLIFEWCVTQDTHCCLQQWTVRAGENRNYCKMKLCFDASQTCYFKVKKKKSQFMEVLNDMVFLKPNDQNF